MTPDEARELFSEAYDGQLSPEQQRAFEAQLAADVELQAEYEEFRALLGQAHSLALDDEAPAPDLLGPIQNKLRERSGGRFYRDRFSQLGGRPGRSALTPLLLAGTMLVVIAAAWLVLHYVQIDPVRVDAPPRSPTSQQSVDSSP
jgi:anti-sigma factor RsiW